MIVLLLLLLLLYEECIERASSGCLSVSPQLERVSVLPGCVRGTALDVVGSVSLLSQTSALSAGGSQTSHLSVLVNGVADPVDLGIVSDSVVRWVDENDIVVLVGTVLVDPVRVQHSHVSASLADSVFSNRLQVSGKLKLVDTVVLGLTEHNTSSIRSLSASSSHGTSVHDVTLYSNEATNKQTIIQKKKTQKVPFLPLPLSHLFSLLFLSPTPPVLPPTTSFHSCIYYPCYSLLLTCLALYPNFRAFSGRVGWVNRTIRGRCLYSQARIRSKKRITSLCLCRQTSSMYL